MACLGHEVGALELCADRMHCFEGAWSLIDGPFVGATDVTGWNINRLSCKAVELTPKRLVGVGTIIVESTLKACPAELRCVDVEIGFGHPLACGNVVR